MSKYQKAILDYFLEYPKASLGEVAKSLGCSKSTVNKYKPDELKSKPLAPDEREEIMERLDRANRALEKLDWYQIKEIRNANNYRLYPVDWRSVEIYFESRNEPIPGGLRSSEELEAHLKEVCDALYDWHLYEPCPKCGKGIRVPRWRAGTGQWTPFCGCSEFPLCDFSADRESNPIGA